jgi:hypothetical protein
MAMAADTPQTQEETTRIRRQRNVTLALVLGALVILFFVMTMVRLGGLA